MWLSRTFLTIKKYFLITSNHDWKSIWFKGRDFLELGQARFWKWKVSWPSLVVGCTCTVHQKCNAKNTRDGLWVLLQFQISGRVWFRPAHINIPPGQNRSKASLSRQNTLPASSDQCRHRITISRARSRAPPYLKPRPNYATGYWERSVNEYQAQIHLWAKKPKSVTYWETTPSHPIPQTRPTLPPFNLYGPKMKRRTSQWWKEGAFGSYLVQT